MSPVNLSLTLNSTLYRCHPFVDGVSENFMTPSFIGYSTPLAMQAQGHNKENSGPPIRFFVDHSYTFRKPERFVGSAIESEC